MNNDNRVRVNVGAGAMAGHERDVDVHADIGVAMQNRTTIAARIGIALMALGFLVALIGLIMFAWGYPHRWYGTGGFGVAYAKWWVELVIVTTAVGLIVGVYGVALYYFGRYVEGTGDTRHFRLGETMEMSEDA